jgi:hypothetical protein
VVLHCVMRHPRRGGLSEGGRRQRGSENGGAGDGRRRFNIRRAPLGLRVRDDVLPRPHLRSSPGSGKLQRPEPGPGLLVALKISALPQPVAGTITLVIEAVAVIGIPPRGVLRKAGADSESTRVAALAMAGKRFSMRKLL